MPKSSIKIKYFINNIFFPHNITCYACSQESKLNDGLCESCHSKLIPNIFVNDNIENINLVISPFEYDENISELIKSFKYNNKRYLARFFAQQISNAFNTHFNIESINKNLYVCAVPSHKNRKKSRGYCQTTLICEEFCNKSNLPDISKSLKRIRDTISQTTLDAKNRATNLENAFIASNNVRNKNILLIDDVVSTGSTLKECALALKNAGANEIYALSVAKSKSIAQQL